jgi:hypothetical protein
MPALILTFAVIGLLLTPAALCGADEGAVPPAAAAPAEKAPASPAELFAALARDTRPQWRQYFRETVPHSAGDRYKAALALGAVCADCYLAAEARDAQQVRNLLTDMASLEMMLSMARPMSSLRQKVTSVAEAGDWNAVREEIATLMARHAELLAEQKDNDLAELERLGLWLRTFHIGARFAARQPAPPARPAVWSGEFLASLHGRAAKLRAGNNSRTLQVLADGFESLTKTWAGETPAANAAERLKATTPVLELMMAELISEPPPPPPAPKTEP